MHMNTQRAQTLASALVIKSPVSVWWVHIKGSTSEYRVRTSSRVQSSCRDTNTHQIEMWEIGSSCSKLRVCVKKWNGELAHPFNTVTFYGYANIISCMKNSLSWSQCCRCTNNKTADTQSLTHVLLKYWIFSEINSKPWNDGSLLICSALRVIHT